jgi:hypothetical protein
MILGRRPWHRPQGQVKTLTFADSKRKICTLRGRRADALLTMTEKYFLRVPYKNPLNLL